jgi:predicted ATPase
MVGFGTFWRGSALAMQGEGEAGLAQMHQGMAGVLATGAQPPFCLVPLAAGLGHTGQVAEGLHLLAEVLAMFEASGHGDLLAEAYRLQGAFLLRQADAVQAEASFQQALAIAHGQQAKSWELRVAVSLARLWQLVCSTTTLCCNASRRQPLGLPPTGSAGSALTPMAATAAASPPPQ